jgi:hypothetical protein
MSSRADRGKTERRHDAGAPPREATYDGSPYARFGDAFARLALVATGAGLVATRSRRDD